MGGATTLDERTVAARIGRARARDRGAVELVRFLAAPLRYLDALREDPRGVVPFSLGGRPAQLVKDPELLAGLDWPAPPARPASAAVAERAARLADSWTEGRPVELVAELRTVLDGWLGGRRFGAGRAMLGGGDLAGPPARVAALAWTLHLLDRHPDVEARWHAELDAVLGERPATAEDLGALVYTRRVIKESMRLYPPIPGFFRQVTGDYAVDGTTIPAGHVIVMSQWVTHRDGDLWTEPLRFDPDRWGDGAPQPPAGSYFPFSAGPYECHARGLATTEAILVLATLGQRWAFRPAAEREPQPVATGTIAPKGGLRMTPTARQRA
jgi:Cytochrome P450